MLQKQLEQEQLLKETYEQEILKTQIEIRDQTMGDVGRELHDHISQNMTVIKINLNLLSGKGLDAAEETRLAETKNMLRETINDIRMLSKTLNGDLIQQIGLEQSIKHELERINRLNVMQCALQIMGKPYDIPATQAFVAFRIMQENLHNILKHAQCKTVTTKLQYAPDQFTLTQHDDGVGFDVEAAKQKDDDSFGSGLHNMQRRAALINAHLEINSQQGQGTTLVLIIAQQFDP